MINDWHDGDEWFSYEYDDADDNDDIIMMMIVFENYKKNFNYSWLWWWWWWRRLTSLFLDEAQSAIRRQSAVLYLASFLSRATFVSLGKIRFNF
jgi:hypothetical protein